MHRHYATPPYVGVPIFIRLNPRAEALGYHMPPRHTARLSNSARLSARPTNFNLSLSPSNNNQGRLCFHAYSGGLTILKLLRFAKAVIHDSPSKKVVLIVDNLRIHHAKIVRAWAARHRDEIKIFYLPAYSPELNPDELVNGDLKPGVGQREPAANKEELRMQIVEHMEETKSNPEKVKNFFRKASVRYASNNHVLLPEQ